MSISVLYPVKCTLYVVFSPATEIAQSRVFNIAQRVLLFVQAAVDNVPARTD